MSKFTVRVELHDATAVQYQTLHDRLALSGFKQMIDGEQSDGQRGWWRLPTAEYDYAADDETARGICDKVKIIADSVKSGAWVLVTEAKSRSWSTRKIMDKTDT